ncbi:unnamed protein product [Penicillium bialowiezense]
MARATKKKKNARTPLVRPPGPLNSRQRKRDAEKTRKREEIHREAQASTTPAQAAVFSARVAELKGYAEIIAGNIAQAEADEEASLAAVAAANAPRGQGKPARIGAEGAVRGAARPASAARTPAPAGVRDGAREGRPAADAPLAGRIKRPREEDVAGPRAPKRRKR